MKKLSAIVIAIAMFVIVSCGNKAATTTTAAETTTTIAVVAETNIVEEVPVNTAEMAETSAGQAVGLE